MLVKVLDVLSLLLELFLDGQKPAVTVSSRSLEYPNFQLNVRIDGCAIGLATGFEDVLGLLFLADVQLFGGGLALGERITEYSVSLFSFLSLEARHIPSSGAGSPRGTRAGRSFGHAESGG